MKLGLKAIVIALVMVLAAVPAASAKNGGQGGGKPSWAGGGGKPSWAGSGKPSWAGSGHASTKAHEKKPKKDKVNHHEADSSSDDGTQSDGADLEGLNPAQYCKTLRDEMTQLELDFAEMFGLNPNHANAFGKCVSRRAHGEDLSGAAGGDDQQGEDNPCEASGTATSKDSGPDREGSDEETTDSEECSGDDSASDESAGDEQGQNDDEQGEDQGEDGGDASNEGDSSDLGAALSFLRL